MNSYLKYTGSCFSTSLSLCGGAPIDILRSYIENQRLISPP